MLKPYTGFRSSHRSLVDKGAFRCRMHHMDTEQVSAFLNTLVALDPDAMMALVESRVPCNEVLADHPTVQVHVGEGGQPMVGLLGILNGLVGDGRLCAVYDDNGRLLRFRPL
jgi:hypothetical protein